MRLVADRYRIESEIGRGTAAVVFKAYDERTHHACALKVLRTTRRPDETWRRFEREVQLMTELRHPHILRVFDYDLEGRRPWMAMAWARAGSVRQHLDRRGPLPLGDVLVHAVEILGALDTAHRAGVIHRDIKPSNLLKTSSGLKVADFGVAALTAERSANGAVGSMGFLAPEAGTDALSPLSDLFSVGVTLFVMATRGNPFDLVSDGPRSARMRQLPVELREIVHRATRRDPRERFGDAREMAVAVREAVAGASFQPLVERAMERSVGLAEAAATGYADG